MLKEKLLEDLKSAMKDKDINRKNAVQMVRTAVLQVEKDKKIDVSDEQILDIIAKEIKKRKEALVDFEKAGREDLIQKTNKEINAIEVYLPKQLTDEELKEKLQEIVKELGATTMKDMGNVMKRAKEAIGASADGKRINECVKELLS